MYANGIAVTRIPVRLSGRISHTSSPIAMVKNAAP